MSVSITSKVLKSRSGSVQFHRLLACYRSWQWQSVCWVHSRCRLVPYTHHPVTYHQLPAAASGLCRFSAGITRAQLPHLYSGVRWFSDNERDRNDDGGTEEFKGFVFRVPHPLAWLKDKWFTYRIHSLVDPLFNLREFQIGAKQVCYNFMCSIS